MKMINGNIVLESGRGVQVKLVDSWESNNIGKIIKRGAKRGSKGGLSGELGD